MEPPIAPRIPVERTLHGDTVIDDYRWLSDPKDPRTLAYLEAENAHTEVATRHLAGLRDRIFDEIKQRTQETDLSAPVERLSGGERRRVAELPAADPLWARCCLVLLLKSSLGRWR